MLTYHIIFNDILLSLYRVSEYSLKFNFFRFFFQCIGQQGPNKVTLANCFPIRIQQYVTTVFIENILVQ